MQEGKLVGFTERVLSPVTMLFAKIGSGILIVMILITVADVLGRKFLNLSVKGSFELGEMLLVLVVFFNLPNTEMQDGNVSIDLLFIRFSQRTQKIVQCVMYILFLVIAILMTWQLFVLASDEWSEGFTTTTLKIPTSPVIFLAAIGCLLLSFVVLVRLILMIGVRK